MLRNNEVVHCRISKKAKKFIKKESKKFGSVRKFLISLLVLKGYERCQDDL